CQIFNVIDHFTGYGHAPPGLFGWQVHRTGEIRQIFKQVFNAAGRGGEIFAVANIQSGNYTAIFQGMTQAKNEGLPIDGFANAPYWEMPTDPGTWLPLMYSRGMDLVCDMACYHLNTMWTPRAVNSGSIQPNYSSVQSPLSFAFGMSDGNSGIKTL